MLTASKWEMCLCEGTTVSVTAGEDHSLLTPANIFMRSQNVGSHAVIYSLYFFSSYWIPLLLLRIVQWTKVKKCCPSRSLYFLGEVDKQCKTVQLYGILWQVPNTIWIRWECRRSGWGEIAWNFRLYVQGRMTWLKADVVTQLSGEKCIIVRGLWTEWGEWRRVTGSEVRVGSY